MKTRASVPLPLPPTLALSLLALMSASSAAAATPQSIAVSGPSTIAQGGTGQYSAMVTNTDGSTTDVTSQATWQVFENQIATVSAGKVTTGVLPGQFTVRASYGSFVGSSAGTLLATVPAAKVVNVNSSMSPAQINSAISSAAVGSEVVFAAGTYQLGYSPCCGIIAKSGLTYTGPTSGSSPASLIGTGGYQLFTVSGDSTSIVIQHFQLNGGGLYFNASQSKFNFEYNEVENIPYQNSSGQAYSNPGATDGIFQPGILASSDVSYNNWHNLAPEILSNVNEVINGAAAMSIGSSGGGGGVSHTTFNFNTFNMINEGIHVLGNTSDGQAVQINNNTFTNFHRIPIELQSDTFSGLEVASNSISQPYKPDYQTYGISAAIGNNTGAVNIHDNAIMTSNVAINPACTGSGCHYGYGLEIWGTNTVGNRNLLQGSWGTPIEYSCTHAMTLSNNSICTGGGTNYIGDETSAQNCGSGYVSSGVTLTNNAESTANSCSFAAGGGGGIGSGGTVLLGNSTTSVNDATSANYFNDLYAITGNSSGGYTVNSGTVCLAPGTVTNGAKTDVGINTAPTSTTEGATALCHATYTNTSSTSPGCFTVPLSGCGTLKPNTPYWLWTITNDPIQGSPLYFSNCGGSCTGAAPTSSGIGTYGGFYLHGTYGTYTGMSAAFTGGPQSAQPTVYLNVTPH